jgi:hypothetical protein
MNAVKLIGLCVVGGLSFGGLMGLASGGRPSIPDAPQGTVAAEVVDQYDYCRGEECMATVKAEEAVRMRLHSPSAADFDRWSLKAKEAGPCTWIVTGHFEAPNGFGVMLQRTFAVRVKREPDRWRLIDVVIG